MPDVYRTHIYLSFSLEPPSTSVLPIFARKSVLCMQIRRYRYIGQCPIYSAIRCTAADHVVKVPIRLIALTVGILVTVCDSAPQF